RGSKEPEPAPAELVIGPVRAAGDAERQAHPGAEHPRPYPARPGRVDATFDESRNSEGERDREADITEVEHRRMEREAGVLQDRIEIAALERRIGDTQERVRCDQNEQ